VAAGTNDAPIGMLFLKEITMDMEWLKTGAFLGSIMFALMGVIIFLLAFVIIDKLTPYNLWEEIVEKQNRALALVVAAMSLGICIIVAAAIHG
jgi:uncharacterized membrane protein YjfL (UPF0719 family)